jgi:hypothetical protein
MPLRVVCVGTPNGNRQAGCCDGEKSRRREQTKRRRAHRERAWLVVELVPVCARYGVDRTWYRPIADSQAPLSQAELEAGEQFRHQLVITNMGRTPALIIKYEISCSRESTHPPIEQSMDFGMPYRSLAATWSYIAREVNLGQFIRESPDEVRVYFSGSVTYQHVFSRNESVQEEFAYFFSRADESLEWLPLPELKTPS